MKRIFFLAIILCVYGCSKEPPPVYHYVSNSVKTDFNFKLGTYWIMKDSISGRVDSFFVISNNDVLTQTEQGGDDYPAEYTENIRINISDYNTDPSHAIDSQYWGYDYGSSYIGFVSDGIGYELFNYPRPDSFSVSTSYQSERDTGIINHVFSTLQINSLSFNTVVVTNHHYSTSSLDSNGNITYFRYNDQLYVCPKIGIVKMRLDRHPQDTIERVWEIQRWNIVM